MMSDLLGPRAEAPASADIRISGSRTEASCSSSVGIAFDSVLFADISKGRIIRRRVSILLSAVSIALLMQVLLLAAPVGAAFSVTLGFDNITNNDPTDAADGEAQLAVTVACPVNGNTNQVSFTFTNTGSAAMSITDVYFDDGTLLRIASTSNRTHHLAIGRVETTPHPRLALRRDSPRIPNRRRNPTVSTQLRR